MRKLPNLAEASDQEVVAWAHEGDEDAYRENARLARWCCGLTLHDDLPGIESRLSAGCATAMP